MGDDARGAGTPRGGGAAERRGIFGGIFRYFRTTTGVVHYPPRKHRLLFRGSPATNQPPDGGGIQRTQYKSVKKIPRPPPFPGILESPNLTLSFSHLVPLQYPLHFTHMFYSCGFRVRYIQVTRSAEAGTDGLHATVQALTIVRAKCAGAIHLTVRRVPGRALAQLLLEEESCVEWCPDTQCSSPSSSSEPSSEPEELEPRS